VGLESSGLHANGYSLVRKVLLEDGGLDLDAVPEGLGCPLGEELLRPTVIYAPGLLRMAAAADVRGLAHVTGGGIPENLGRVIPAGLEAVVQRGTWPTPPIFDLIARTGDVAAGEMLSTFNMGIGMIAVVPPHGVGGAMEAAEGSGLRPHRIGRIAAGGGPDRVRFD
jgi:phosphoribosylformylglycinamidine cyclo-ligase